MNAYLSVKTSLQDHKKCVCMLCVWQWGWWQENMTSQKEHNNFSVTDPREVKIH